MSHFMDRRRFLQLLGIGGASAAAVMTPAILQAQDSTEMPGMADATPAPAAAGTDYKTMDAMHAEGIQTFLDNIGKDEIFWRKPMEYTMDGDTKVFKLTAQNINWETSPGVSFPAMAYNGIIPGPEIRVTEGDKIRVEFNNQMSESSSIHWHGLRIPNDQDGVTFITQQPVEPGQTFNYEFTLRNSGTHMYHSHHNSALQVSSGLLGPIIVEPKDKSSEPEVDAEYLFILNDSTLGFTINGKGFPYTQPLMARLGQKIRIRYMNEGFMIHPMHLHGIPQLVIAKDGYPVPQPYLCDTLNVAPGERYDVIVDCNEPGIWAFHCHILTHAESAHGMFGMVTVLIVQA